MGDRRTVLVWLLGAALLVGACGGDDAGADDRTFPPDTFAIVANSDIGVGRSRVLFGILEGGGRRVGSPEDAITVTVTHTDDPSLTATADGIFTWIVDGAFGLYRAEFDLSRPGLWRADIQPASGPALPSTGFEVVSDTAAPAIGERAPAPHTATLSDATFEELTTDPDPDPSFYDLSLDEALGNGRRTVVVFSTPAFCQTATCGPLLDIVKSVAPDHPDVDFVHVEVYTNLTDPNFSPVPSYLAPAVLADWWNLPSEPWVFVVDEDGFVTHRFEGVMAAEELVAAL